MMMAMRRPALILAIAMLCPLALACAQDQEEPAAPPPVSKKAASDMLSHNVVVPLKVVRQFFPALTRQLEAGVDAAAFGKPSATRRVIYVSGDGAQRITISVDNYTYGSEALLAYQQAAQKTQLAEFESIAISGVGQQVFGGTMKQDSETQVTITASDDKILLTVTLAGYEATTDNIAKLADLARLEISEAHARVKR